VTTLITLVVIVYVAGVIGTAFVGWSNWSIARSMVRDYEEDDQPFYLGNDFIERQRAKYEREAQEGARRFAQSPMWPLLALGALARIINDSRKDTTP